MITGVQVVVLELLTIMTGGNHQNDHLIMMVEAAEAEASEVEAVIIMTAASEVAEAVEETLVEVEHASNVVRKDISLENVPTKTLAEATEAVIVEAEQAVVAEAVP